MNVSTSRLKIVSTPGFARESAAHNLDPLWTLKQAGRLLKSEEPSWVVGDPKFEAEGFDDEGRTLLIPAPFRLYVIRDGHHEGCDCGCGAGPSTPSIVITFLLPEEY